MRVRPLTYFVLFLFDMIIFAIQYQAFQTQMETITILEIGHFNVPRQLFIIPLVSSLLMLPYFLVLTVGAIAEAEWLFTVRLWAGITAIIMQMAHQLFLGGSFTAMRILTSPLDPTLIYLIAEASVTVWEAVE